MIYITGDCHYNFNRFSSRNFPEQKIMTKDDYVVICGDFGYWEKSKEMDFSTKFRLDFYNKYNNRNNK